MDKRTRDLVFSSKTSEHETPFDLFEQLDEEFGFDVDVAATALNAKCKTFFGTQADETFIDGLEEDWGHPNANIVAWCNPPYGREISKWIEKAIAERDKNHVSTVMLLPVRTDTAWFHDLIEPNVTEIRFIRGRLKFSGASAGAPFPSMLVVFWYSPSEPLEGGKYKWATLGN